MNAGGNVLRWIDQAHPQSYFWLVASVIIGALILALVSLVRDEAGTTNRHDWSWAAVLTIILGTGRWPTFLITREMNPDESQLLAGAHTLVHDPVFWRSVDGMSSGPLNYFALWPAGWLCGWDSYLAARVTAFVLLALTFILAHQCMSLVLGRRVARLAGLGAVCFEALTNAVDLLHYSSELPAVALLTAAIYCAIQRCSHPTSGPGWNGLGGLLLGAMPLTKLQAMPLAAVVGLGWLVAECRPFLPAPPDAWRRRIYLLAGALVPAGLFASQLTIAGEWQNAVVPYYAYNLQYMANGSPSLRQLAAAMLAKSFEQDSLLLPWLAGSVVWVLLMLRIGRPVVRATRLFGLAAVAGCAVALFSIAQPGRPFLHYWQFLVVPLTFLLGTAMAVLLPAPPQPTRPSDRWLVAVCTLCLVGTLLVHRALRPNSYVGALVYLRENPCTELAAFTARFARPGEAIAIWGWSSYVYVETGLRQGTRDAHFERAVEPGPYREFFRRRFVADLMHSQPELFLDSSGPSSLYYHDPRFAHERDFPELAALIESRYIQVGELSGARLYVRRDWAKR